MGEAFSRSEVIDILTAGYQTRHPEIGSNEARRQAELVYEGVRMAAYFKGTEAGENVAVAGSVAMIRRIPVDLLMPPGFYEGLEHAAKVVEAWPARDEVKSRG